MMSLTRRSSKDLERYLLHSASRTLAAVLVAAAWPVAAFADEPQLREAIEYYEITGKTARQLREAMDRSGPIGSDGKRFDGHTGWWIEHNFGLQETDAGCEVVGVDVSVEVTMTLPRWSDESRASKRLAQRWRRYMTVLKLHEEGHREIAVEAARVLMERLREVPAQPNCSRLKLVMELTTEGVLADCRSRNAAYDRETEHGKTQGATFP